MRNLYKGRYLIAIYDKDDNCLGVFNSIKELKEANFSTYLIYKMFDNKYLFLFNKCYLIDCLEKHDDVFNKEDEIFLNECGEKITNKDKAKQLNMSLRTYYRKRQYLEENEL